MSARMDRDPGEFERRDGADPAGAAPPTPQDDAFALDEETLAAIAEARRDVAAGRVIPHEQVAAWLETWGTPDYKPMPREWLR